MQLRTLEEYKGSKDGLHSDVKYPMFLVEKKQARGDLHNYVKQLTLVEDKGA